MRVKREVVQKKMSVIGEDGRVKWSMKETTILACTAKQPRIPGSQDIAAMSSLSKLGTTNHKRVKVSKDEDQSHLMKTEDKLAGRLMFGYDESHSDQTDFLVLCLLWSEEELNQLEIYNLNLYILLTVLHTG